MPTIVLQSSKDTNIQESNPTTNTGTATVISTRGTTVERSLLSFPLISLPGTITLATLTLTQASAGTPVTSVKRLLQTGWTETGATWNTYDGTNAWGTIGADGDAIDSTTKNAASFSAPGNNQTTSVIITDMVQDALDAGNVNIDILLKLTDETGSENILYNSRDEPSEVLRPQLSVSFDNETVSSELLTTSDPAFVNGTILGQVVSFTGTKTISKSSLDLSIIAEDKTNIIVGESGIVSFQAANWQESRDDWQFQPVLNWISSNNWETSGTTISNTLQSESYTSVADAVTNAPFLKYNFFVPGEAIYDLWGYGDITGDGIFWSLDEDITNLRRFTLGPQTGTPEWTHFARVLLEGGTHSFTVYLGNVANVAILDQWYFTTNTTLGTEVFTNSQILTTPLPLSKSPFNTACRLRSLNNGALDDLENPVPGAASITAWANSQGREASTKYNYEIRDNDTTIGVDFTDGSSIEFWQIGGSSDFFAAWDIIFID